MNMHESLNTGGFGIKLINIRIILRILDNMISSHWQAVHTTDSR